MHVPASKPDKDHAADKKAKLGIYLFLVYVLLYSGFVVIGLYDPDLMGLHILGKMNLSIVYGFGLIFLAIIMGFIYNHLCNRLEKKMNDLQKGGRS